MCLILWHFLEKFMVPPYAIITWKSSAGYMKQLRISTNLNWRNYGHCQNQSTLFPFSFWYILVYWGFLEYGCRSVHEIILLDLNLISLDLVKVPILDLLPLQSICRITSCNHIYATYYTLCHYLNIAFWSSFIHFLRCDPCWLYEFMRGIMFCIVVSKHIFYFNFPH